MILSKKRTKLIALFIAVLFLYNSFGYLFLYFPVRTIIKNTVFKSIEKKQIAQEELSVLAFNLLDLKKNKYDFIWEKPGKEFRFNDKMYDIENKVISGDTVYYTVFYDYKENILEEFFSLQQKENKKDKSQSSSQRVLLVGLYYEQIKYISFKINISSSSNLPLNNNEADFLNHTSDVLTPPPRNNV